MSDVNPKPRNMTARVLGVILMIVGYLLLSAAGLCTLVFGGMLLNDPSAEDIALVLVYGGIPMILGALIAWAGHALWRRGRGSSFGPPPRLSSRKSGFSAIVRDPELGTDQAVLPTFSVRPRDHALAKCSSADRRATSQLEQLLVGP